MENNEKLLKYVCCICFEESESSENFIQSECDCKVWCHGTCLAGWLMKGGNCPQCRKHFVNFENKNSLTDFFRDILNVIEPLRPILEKENPKPKKVDRSCQICNGCKKSIKIEDYENHYEECKIKCPYGCNKIIFYKEKLDHYKVCPNKKY